MAENKKNEPAFRELCDSIIEASIELWKMGWTPRNTGAISARLTPAQLLDEDFFRGGKWTETGVKVPETAGDYYLVPGAGGCFSGRAPGRRDCLGVVEMNPSGESFRTIWGLKETGRPIDEFPLHLHCHGVRQKASDDRERVVVYAGCPNAAALSGIIEGGSGQLSKLLWESQPESIALLPRGCGFIAGAGSETEAWAMASAVMRRPPVAIVQYRGVTASGATVGEALSLAGTVERAAEVYLKCAAAGGMKSKPSKDYLMSIAAQHGAEPDPVILELFD